ncbi:MAG: hypothetical protein ABJA89_18510 [Lapillicoccus sp.]
MLTASRPLPSAADAVVLLLTQPRPAGRRTAVVASAAGVSAAAAAALEQAGLLPADVTQHCDMRTRFVAPTATHTGGSVTLPSATAGVSLGAVLATLAEDPGVDAIVVAVDPAPWSGAQLARTLDAVSRQYPRVTVVAAVPLARPARAPAIGTVPSFPDLRRAAQALAAAVVGQQPGGEEIHGPS